MKHRQSWMVATSAQGWAPKHPPVTRNVQHIELVVARRAGEARFDARKCFSLGPQVFRQGDDPHLFPGKVEERQVFSAQKV